MVSKALQCGILVRGSSLVDSSACGGYLDACE